MEVPELGGGQSPSQAGTKSCSSSLSSDLAVGSAPSWGGAKGPLTPPRHQISAWLLQQKELDCPRAPIIPSTALAAGHLPWGRRMMGTRDEAQVSFWNHGKEQWRGQGRHSSGWSHCRHWGSNGAGEWPCLPWGQQSTVPAVAMVSLSLGRVWGSPVPAMDSLRLEEPSETPVSQAHPSRCSAPGASLAAGMWVSLPEDTAVFLGFLSLALMTCSEIVMPSICQSPAGVQQSMPRQEAVPHVAGGAEVSPLPKQL